MKIKFWNFLRESHKYSHKIALRAAVLYAVAGVLWIVFSDRLVAVLAKDIHLATKYQTYKGWAFIVLTSIILYAIVRGYLELLATANRALLDSEQMFSTAFHNSPESLSISRLDDGIYIDVNKGFTELLGYSREEVLGKSAKDLNIWVSIEKRNEIVEKLLMNEQVLGLELQFRHKDGTIKPVLMSGSILSIKGQHCLMAISKDISDRKRIEEATVRFNRELENKNKELESIIFVASHDLRSSLVNIQGFGKELTMSCDALRTLLNGPDVPEKLKQESRQYLEDDIPESVDFINTNTAKIDNLLTGILRISRITREPANDTLINMDELMGEIMREKKASIDRDGVSVSVDKLPECYGDRFQIRELFFNLIENGLKFLDSSRAGRITVSGRVEDNHSIYCVEDNGIGIDPKYQEKIFEMFNTLEPTRYGEGLGLVIVKRIAQRHNGRVWVESKVGEGSRFYVLLPRA